MNPGTTAAVRLVTYGRDELRVTLLGEPDEVSVQRCEALVRAAVSTGSTRVRVEMVRAATAPSSLLSALDRIQRELGPRSGVVELVGVRAGDGEDVPPDTGHAGRRSERHASA